MFISYGTAADSVVLGVFLCRGNKPAGRRVFLMINILLYISFLTKA